MKVWAASPPTVSELGGGEAAVPAALRVLDQVLGRPLTNSTLDVIGRTGSLLSTRVTPFYIFLSKFRSTRLF